MPPVVGFRASVCSFGKKTGYSVVSEWTSIMEVEPYATSSNSPASFIAPQ